MELMSVMIKRVYIFIFIPIFVCLLPFMEAAGQTIAVRVMSMNIKEGASYASNKSEPYAELIKEYDPDFVCLQEVDYKTIRNGNRDWLNEVARQTGMFPYYCKSFSYQGGGFGTAILSKYPFFKAFKTIFSASGTREDRASGWVYVQLPAGQTVRVATTHLALESADITTKHIASVNTAIFAEDTVTPTLLVGDFNATPDSDPIKYAKIKWQEIAPGKGNTIPSSNPNRQLDYVMGYPKNWTYSKYEIIAHPELSDHCFIVADVSIDMNE